MGGARNDVGQKSAPNKTAILYSLPYPTPTPTPNINIILIIISIFLNTKIDTFLLLFGHFNFWILNFNIFKHEDRYVFVTCGPFQMVKFNISLVQFSISLFQVSSSIFQFFNFQFQFSIFNFYPHIPTPLKSIKLDPIYRRTINHLGDEYAMKTPYWKI